MSSLLFEIFVSILLSSKFRYIKLSVFCFISFLICSSITDFPERLIPVIIFIKSES